MRIVNRSDQAHAEVVDLENSISIEPIEISAYLYIDEPVVPLEGPMLPKIEQTLGERSGDGQVASGTQKHGSRGEPPVHDHRLGTVLTGRYRLEKLIGKGGMGRVYLATQFPLNRPVAVKILNPEFQKTDPQFVRRFFLEASTASRLTHPNTFTVFDYGESEAGELFIAMEYIDGRPLSRVIAQESPFPALRALYIALQICRSLREAHQKGIIHRDLKPGNILLLDEGDDLDFVKVLDFGLVKLFNPNAGEVFSEPLPSDALGCVGCLDKVDELTRAGMFLGSPKYMSPEQIRGTALGPQTDIYSLGVLMFQMLAGKAPYSGTSSVEVIYKHVHDPVPRLADLSPGVEVPEELERLVQQCMCKRPQDRFASMGELLIRLKDIHRGLTGLSSIDLFGSTSEVRPREDDDKYARLPIEPALWAHELLGGEGEQGSTVHLYGSLDGCCPNLRPDAGGFSESPPVSVQSVVLASVRRRQEYGLLAKVAPILALGALVLALGVLIYVLASGVLGWDGPAISIR